MHWLNKQTLSQLAISKTQKMTEYFTEQRNIGDTGTGRSESKKYIATTEADVEIVQQEKGTVEEEDASTTIFIFSNDLGLWLKRLSESDREYWIETVSMDCQHSNSNFSKPTRFYKAKRLPEPAPILTSKLFIDSQIDYAILKAKVGFSVFPAK